MCNQVHDESSRGNIPKKGMGWKLFLEKPGPVLAQWANYQQGYIDDEDGWVRWKFKRGNGFSFFLDLKEARRALLEVKKKYPIHMEGYRDILWEIEYDEGICWQLEEAFIDSPVKMALCGAFRLKKEVGEGGETT
jgi:hypothetical protein